MSYTLILFTIGFFILTVLFHVYLQKGLKIKKIVLLLFINFIFFPVIIFVLILITQLILGKLSILHLLAGLLLYLSLASAYIQTFPAIQTFAPTLRIVYELGKFSKEGLTENQIIEYFPPESMLDDGIDHLLQENFICLQDNVYTITSKGKLMANLFVILRKLYRLDKGLG